MGKLMARKFNWHIRIAITSRCNFRCIYCNPHGIRQDSDELTIDDVREILHAAYVNGIRRVHWTGGEPTLRRDFLDILCVAKEIGYTEQILTTNGHNLYRIIDDAIECGLSRVLVSLDTLNPMRFKHVTGTNTALFSNVLKSIEAAVEKLSSLTKINVVTMKSTLMELKDFVDYVADVNSRKTNKGKLALKLIQLCAINPIFLTELGVRLIEKEYTSYSNIINELKKIGPIKKLAKEEVEGDNPNCEYYLVKNKNVIVGVLAMYSWGFPCGHDYCHKLRVTPYGYASICLTDNLVSLKGKPLDEKIRIIRELMSRRKNLDRIKPHRRHYRDYIGETRFGNLGKAIPINTWLNILKQLDPEAYEKFLEVRH